MLFNFKFKGYEMADLKHIIEPERLGLWVAVTFILALLALVTALVGIQRNNELAYITQAEVLLLNKKAEGMKPEGNAPAAAAKAETR